MLHIIRAFLFAIAYPLTSRIGLKTNKRETLFQVYGGLRGAVGIALAIALDNEVTRATGGTDQVATEQSKKLFGFVGGFAFLTLIINGTTAGPLLRRLGLSDSTETRLKIGKSNEAYGFCVYKPCHHSDDLTSISYSSCLRSSLPNLDD